MEGHGDHWSCIEKDVSGLIRSWLPVILENGQLMDRRERSLDSQAQPLAKCEAVGIAFPQTDLRALALLGKGHDKGDDPHYLVLSAYPYATRGVRHRLTVENISPWQADIEARIEAAWNDGPSVTFFDTHYYANKARYVIGETYEFVLAGLAYSVELTRPEPIFITDPERIRAMRTFSGESDITDAAVDMSPIELSLQGAAILLPCQDLAPDDYTFQAPVKEVESFDMNGLRVTRLRCTVLRLDSDIDIELYATAEAMRGGEQARVDDDVRGMLWLQGYLAE